ncbi:hypothetical protein WJX73_007336 [Symbiochloris irregularis]|uniref:Uncharacterized protein n=1 Tax=Symbiochloris irregularis TaxID=706552 RepID=A0AAW1PJP3_9CHLO
MAELDGLNMSLDELISKRHEEERRKQGQTPGGRGGGRFHGRGGRWQNHEGRGGRFYGPPRQWDDGNFRGPGGPNGRGRGRGGPPQGRGDNGFGTFDGPGGPQGGRGGFPGGGMHLPPFPLQMPFMGPREVSLGGPGQLGPAFRPMPMPFMMPMQPPPEPLPPPQLSAYVKPETQEVAVKFRNSEILKVTESGAVKLDSGGFRGPSFIQAMNAALKPLGMKISGASFAQLTISDGRSITRYEDGVTLPGKGAATESRARDVLKAFSQNNTPKPPEATPPSLLDAPPTPEAFLAMKNALSEGKFPALQNGSAPNNNHHHQRSVAVTPARGGPRGGMSHGGGGRGGGRDWDEGSGGGPHRERDQERSRLRAQGRYVPY